MTSIVLQQEVRLALSLILSDITSQHASSWNRK